VQQVVFSKPQILFRENNSQIIADRGQEVARGWCDSGPKALGGQPLA
jgi:hypothetical protein